MNQKNPFLQQQQQPQSQETQEPQVQQEQALQGEVISSSQSQPQVQSSPQMVNQGSNSNSDRVEYDGDVLDITFDDDVKISTLERFPRLKKGEVARFAFVLFDERGNPLVKHSNYFYDQISKSTILAPPKDSQALNLLVKKFGEPKQRFGTIILKYRTDESGNMFQGDLSFNIYAFIFSTDKFPSFKNLNREWGLNQHDVLAQCNNEDFQKWDIQIARDIMWHQIPNAQEISNRCFELYNKYLPKFMGKKYSEEEIFSLLGVSMPGMGMRNTLPAPGSVNPFGPQAGMINQVGTGQPQKEDFSNLIKK